MKNRAVNRLEVAHAEGLSVTVEDTDMTAKNESLKKSISHERSLLFLLQSMAPLAGVSSHRSER